MNEKPFKRQISGQQQSGQTLIETIVAIFILVTALSAGLGVALTAMQTSEVSKKQLVATNLAREGIDIVRMMRDSNWLVMGATGNSGLRLQSCPDINSKLCYPRAHDAALSANTPHYTYDSGLAFNLMQGSSNNHYRMIFNPAGRPPTSVVWRIERKGNSANDSYLLCLDPDGTYRHAAPGPGGRDRCNEADFARRITISVVQPYNYSGSNNNFRELVVKSIVMWNGRNCPAVTISTVPNDTPARCKTIVEDRMTNWKDYR
jgi:type II secretory pathway pseudopilin PulG